MSDKNTSIFSSDIFSRLMSLSYLPRWVVFFCDFAICAVSYFIVYCILSKLIISTEPEQIISPFWGGCIILFSQIVFFWFFHTYSGVLRYSSYVDAAKLLMAVCCNLLFLFVANLIVHAAANYYLFYLHILVGYGCIAFFVLFFLRLVVKVAYDFYIQNINQIIPVMIYGTRSAGVGIAKMIRSTQNSKYKLVGFIDDEGGGTGNRMIMGYKVYNSDEETVKNVIARKVKSVIVSPLKMESINPNKDLDVFLNNGLSIYTAPMVDEWKENDTKKESKLQAKHIKSIQIEDLLERPQINISTENISKQLVSKVVLVTGAAGSIGSEIVRQMVKYKPSLIILLDQAESPIHELRLELETYFPNQNITTFLGDVRNKERMRHMMSTYRPDFIYHAAAYKHVPLMEDNPVESIQVNVAGTKTMADLAVEYNVKRFVMVSTDKAVNPTNVMGASKRIAEIYVQSLYNKLKEESEDCTKFITTRFGNVLGSNGSVIPYFKKQIERGGPITVTHPEITRYFMTIPEACVLVLEAGAMGNGGEIYIFDMGQPVKIADLARKMIRLSGYKPEEDIKIIYTGLRQGEKLYEELLNNKEITTETHNPKIMIANVRKYDFNNVKTNIEELIHYGLLCKDYMVVSLMKKIVPEFLSKNSPYEKIDVENGNSNTDS